MISVVLEYRQDFRFHSKPYYLRLNLPGEIIENDEAKADFDADTNEFKIACPKVNKGEHFKGLDMLTSLLEPKGKRSVDEKLIQVVGEEASSALDESESESEFDWFLEQNIPDEEERASSLAAYGFASQHSGLFAKLAEELREVLDVKDPDHQTLAQRRTSRIECENDEFNPEHYLADYFQLDMIKSLLEYEMTQVNTKEEWTRAEQDLLKSFPRKDILMDSNTVQSVYLGLVDIILAYSYDMRSNMDDHNVESAWVISKLSGTLSWLEVIILFYLIINTFVKD